MLTCKSRGEEIDLRVEQGFVGNNWRCVVQENVEVKGYIMILEKFGQQTTTKLRVELQLLIHVGWYSG